MKKVYLLLFIMILAAGVSFAQGENAKEDQNNDKTDLTSLSNDELAKRLDEINKEIDNLNTKEDYLKTEEPVALDYFSANIEKTGFTDNATTNSRLLNPRASIITKKRLEQLKSLKKNTEQEIAKRGEGTK